MAVLSGNFGTLGFFMGVLGAAYFVPTFVAIVQKRANLQTIFLLNLVLGWTIVGWVVALIWAVGPRERKRGRSRLPWSRDAGRKPCPSCGRSLRKETRQCRHCGYTLQTRE